MFIIITDNIDNQNLRYSKLASIQLTTPFVESSNRSFDLVYLFIAIIYNNTYYFIITINVIYLVLQSIEQIYNVKLNDFSSAFK